MKPGGWRMRLARWFGVVVSLSLICLSVGQSQRVEGGGKERLVEVTVTSRKKVFAVGEPIVVSYAVRNRGETAFYIPTSLEWGGPAGGFEVKAVTPKRARGIEYGHGLVFIPPQVHPTRDMAGEIEGKSLLLWPGAFYGREAPLPLKALSPGKYKIFVIYHGLELTEDEVESLKGLKYPLLRGTYRSRTIEVTVR